MPLNEEEENDIEYWGNDDPKCPFCDYEIDISAHDLYRLYEEGEHKISCPKCNKEMIVISNCTWMFHTDEQEDL